MYLKARSNGVKMKLIINRSGFNSPRNRICSTQQNPDQTSKRNLDPDLEAVGQKNPDSTDPDPEPFKIAYEKKNREKIFMIILLNSYIN